MRIRIQPSNRGIALIIVMVVVLVLGVLAGGFAYSMKVETRLAQNTSLEADLEWLGRSGVELAKYVLGQQLTLTPGFTALNQKWAGGPGNTNDLLAAVTLENNHLGAGTYSVKIIDAERKYNVNLADAMILQQALGLLGVDATDASTIIDSILDWRDPDDHPHLSGAESDDYYLRLSPPYFSKNGPVGDITELLLVRGISPELFGGASGLSPMSPPASATLPVGLVAPGAASFAGGLADLFSTAGGPQINLNTASASVLQLIPGIDANVAMGIIQARAGLDGVDGTEDDLPFHNAGELINVPGMNPQFVQQLQRFFGVHSYTFEVQVNVQIHQYQRRFKSLLRRVSAQDVQVLSMFWE